MLNTLRSEIIAMSEIRTFFRHCPGCGRRFEIRLVSKEPVDTEEHNEELTGVTAIPRPSMATGSRQGTSLPTVVHDSTPVTVEMEEFQYTYRCRHCGHEWKEIREKGDEAAKPPTYSGD
jgi:DNA-directed RNA polymerase subunit M/transcription elongation factor TFIIS